MARALIKRKTPIEKLTKKDLLRSLEKYTNRLAAEKEGDERDYANLQHTWNKDILERAANYVPPEAKKIIGIGSFNGALEMAFSPYMEQIVCVDHESFLPKWKPSNLEFLQANLDSNEWKLPEDQGMFDMSFCIETIEHLLWSPLPLLTWMRTYSHIAVISTPDDDEWPKMQIRPWTRYQHFSHLPAAAPGVQGNPMPMHHCKQYKQAEFIEMLDFVGFRVLEFFRVGDGKHQMCAIVQPRND
jgi:hypothetical protein